MTRDLTERKLSEEKEKKYIAALEFRNRELEQFAYIASHDMQEPLRKISMFSEIIENRAEDKDAVSLYLHKITKAASRMSNLINDVLNYSKLSDSSDISRDIDLNKILEEVKDDLEVVINKKNVTISSDKLPVIKGISYQFHQLFLNLLSNAIKFNTSEPFIRISTEKVAQEELDMHPELDREVEHIRLLFEDNGIGIDPKYQGQIFKLFQRLNDKNYEGTGIGLALCKRIVENHHGLIYLKSNIHQGSIFEVLLPA